MQPDIQIEIDDDKDIAENMGTFAKEIHEEENLIAPYGVIQIVNDGER